MSKESGQIVRFGIIGCGGIARGKHLPELKPVKEARIIACSDVSEDMAKSFANISGAEKWYTDYHKMLQCDDIDAVIVSTPHPLHSPIGYDVLSAGKHLLIQKPMATKNKDAAKLLEAEKKSGKVVLALPYLYDHTFVKIQELLEKGAIGQITMVRSRSAHNANPGPDSWFSQKAVAEGGALYDMGVYAAWRLVTLLGSVRKVSAMMSTGDSRVDVEKNAILALEFANGAIGVLETSWQQQASLEGDVFYGHEGTIHAGGGPLRVYARHDPKKDEYFWEDVSLPESIPMSTNAHQQFVDAILHGTPVLSTVTRGRHIVEILCAGYESFQTGRTVELETTC
jgi:UDP-N-acetylglucosamine 3-dehydrogenase